MQNTKIEWCDATFNPWTGCTKVSQGCANCYAEGWAKRSGIVQWGPGSPRRRTSEANWKLPLKWNREAMGAKLKHEIEHDQALRRGEKPAYNPLPSPRVFCASLADWLDDEVPIEWLADLLALIHQTPNLDWLLLTKRPKNWKPLMEAALEFYANSIKNVLTDDEADIMNWLAAWIRNDGIDPIPENVWIGTTVENQEMADKRIPQLLSIPAKVRFLSCEPLLEMIDLGWPIAGAPADVWKGGEPTHADRIHWVIAGGESGPKARPMHPDLARSLRDQCEASGVPFFMKQMGGVRKPFPPIPDDLNIRQFPTP